MRNKTKLFSDEVGKIYNYLTVTREDSPKITKSGRSRRWVFTCECGKEKSLSPSNVFNGSTKSCGCKKSSITREAIKNYYDGKYENPVERRLYSAYKKHGKTFKILLPEFITLVNSNCHYCGIKPSKVRYNKTKSVQKCLNGLDRIDSTKGYTTTNVVTCCTDCNIAKNVKTKTQFMCWVERIYKFNN